MDTQCKCKNCGRTVMVSFSNCLLQGWPQCCQRRMTVVKTVPNIEAAIAQALTAVNTSLETTGQKL